MLGVGVRGLAPGGVEPDLEAGVAAPRRRQTPAEPVVPPGVREPQAEMRRAGEATAEERDAVAELDLQPARARGGAVVVIGRGAGYLMRSAAMPSPGAGSRHPAARVHSSRTLVFRQELRARRRLSRGQANASGESPESKNWPDSSE